MKGLARGLWAFLGGLLLAPGLLLAGEAAASQGDLYSAPAAFVGEWLAANPWAFWVWVVATGAAVVVRRRYPDESSRPEWAVWLLLVADLLQVNPSGPTKRLVASKKTEAGPC